jgi:uncharacterized protein (TIGR02099 family)
MFTDQYSSSQTRTRLRSAWRGFQQAYRVADLASRHVLGAVLKLLVLAYFLFCALFLTLRYAVLPNIDMYKTDVERIATRAIGQPVSIGTIHASWHGLSPHLLLKNVIIHDRKGEQALSLPKVEATLSWWSVAAADLRVHSVEISGPDMDILRDKDGKVYVAGILVDPEKEGDGKGLDWVLSQREIVIRDGWVRWNDALRGAPELVLSKVDLVMRNQWQKHLFAIKATPPAGLAAPIDVRADFKHAPFARISDIAQWTGTLYFDWRDTDLAVWKTYINYPIEVHQGKGAVRAWLDFDHAKVADFTADLTLTNAVARLRKDLGLLNLTSVNGRISAREELGKEKIGLMSFGRQGHTIALTDFSFETSDGLKLPPTTISEHFVAAAGGQPESTEIRATSLDLHTLAAFVGYLPLSAAQRQMVADFAPRGQLKNFSARWQGTYPEISAYGIKGQFSGLSINAQAPRPARPASGLQPAQAAVPGIPGFTNLTGEVDANDKGGSVALDSRDLVLRLPGYFSEPEMPFRQLAMRAGWTLQNQNLALQIERMHFVQEGLAGNLSGKHVMPIGRGGSGRPLGVVDMSARISSLDLKRLGRYLPQQTPENLRSWLSGALEDGQARDVAVTIRGDLADFPFRPRPGEKPKGVFTVTGKLDKGRLVYNPGHFAEDGKSAQWPVMEDVKGVISIDRTRLEIKADSAKTSGVAISNTVAVIPDLLAADSMLDVTGTADGPLQEFVNFVDRSPVSGWIARFTDDTKATGDARLQLKLQLPLHHMAEAKVQGTLQFPGNDITLQAAIPPLQQATGELKFHEKGFELNGIKAGFIGGKTTITGGTQRDGTISVKAEGNVSTEGLRKTPYATPVLQRALQRITGGTRYYATVNVRKGRPEVVVETNLTGVTLDFPAPLRKTANENLPLRFELIGLAAEDGGARDEIKVGLGSYISARYQRQKSGERGAQWQVLRGGIGVNVPVPQPDSGVVINVNMRSLNLDAWRAAVTSIVGQAAPVAAPIASPGSTTAARPPAATVASTGSGTGASRPAAPPSLIAQYIDPEVLAVRATELFVMGRKLDNVVVGASHQKDVWQANIDSEQASGYLTWNESRSGRGLGRVTVRLASLIIPQSAASEVTELLEGKNDTTQIPALDIVAENFQLFGKRFGQLELVAANARTPTGREWRISKLSIANDDAVFKAQGKWSTTSGQSMTNMTYALDIVNAGKLLERFGFANVLRGGRGKMDGDMSWKGLPFSIDIPSLSGQLHLDIAAGQFLKVDAAAANASKLLGVLSLQSLPRRLALDFRDIFSEGFAFDGVVATAAISQGIMKTDNFKMRGLNAAVLIDGTVDIARESQNLHVVVIPEINAGAASVVYGLIVNPVIGLGSFLAQLFLRDPLMKAFTVEYDITGPWKDPVVKKIERKPPASAAGQAATSAP